MSLYKLNPPPPILITIFLWICSSCILSYLSKALNTHTHTHAPCTQSSMVLWHYYHCFPHSLFLPCASSHVFLLPFVLNKPFISFLPPPFPPCLPCSAAPSPFIHPMPSLSFASLPYLSLSHPSLILPVFSLPPSLTSSPCWRVIIFEKAADDLEDLFQGQICLSEEIQRLILCWQTHTFASTTTNTILNTTYNKTCKLPILSKTSSSKPESSNIHS